MSILPTKVLRVSTRGLVTIPVSVRRELGIKPDSSLALYVSHGTILLKPVDVPSSKTMAKTFEDVTKRL